MKLPFNTLSRQTLGLLLICSCVAAEAFAITLQGQLRAHDPSRITKCGTRYYVYSTGPNIPMRYSDDLIHWTSGPGALGADRTINGIPAWARALVPGNKGSGVWAPDVLYFEGLYHLYYAFADWNSNDAVIGLITSPTLDPNAADYHWTDCGEIIRAQAGDTINAIDPAPVFDQEGNLWLAFGGMAKGSRLIQLDKKTGLRSAENTTIYQFAGKTGEAPYVYFHDGFYYFFKNHGGCCKGVDSTYRIVMGRSEKITGPYVDMAGKDLMTTEGTRFLTTQGPEIGPGHVGIYVEGGAEKISFHFYDGNNKGMPTMALKTLKWGADGWPLTSED